MRRPPVPLALAAVFALTAGSAPSLADVTPSFKLDNTGTTAIDKVDLNVVPPNAIPSNSTTNPLTLLPGSQGFDPNQLVDLIGSGTFTDGPKAGQPVQVVRLDFGPSGLRPGGELDFSLSVDKALQNSLQLSLPTNATGLALTNTTPPPPPPPTTGPIQRPTTFTPSPNVPEPMSMALWASLSGAGLVVARRRRARA